MHACHVALEILASIATAIGYELDIGLKSASADNDEVDAMEEDDNEEDKVGEMLADMDGVTGDDHQEAISLSKSADSIIRYLVEATAPALIVLSQLQPMPVINLRLRALGALNNLAWTVDAAVPADGPLWEQWEKLTDDIWKSVVSPVLAANTADIELAEAVTVIAWAVAKAMKGGLDVSDGQHRAFIGLYQAALTDELRTKCVGVLGCLALPPNRIEVNQVCLYMSTITGHTNGLFYAGNRRLPGHSNNKCP